MARKLVVLMTAYNAEKTIGRAIESLFLNSEPFDLLIVDDCSRIPVTELVAKTTRNIDIVRCEKNLGVAGAKNFGLERVLTRPYEFVAMIDADDVCRPNRLDKQLAFLTAHRQVALVGCWSHYVDEVTREVLFNFCPPCDSQGIRKALYMNQCIVHPSWMLRTQTLRLGGFYSNQYRAAEDYDLLRRLSPRFEFANLPEFLLDYTISRSGMSMQMRRRQLWDRLRIQLRYFDLWQWRAWLGVVRTIILFGVPLNFVAMSRRRRGLRLPNP
jgi:glycosyltransferase involved in cell wall biosynthesis